MGYQLCVDCIQPAQNGIKWQALSENDNGTRFHYQRMSLPNIFSRHCAESIKLWKAQFSFIIYMSQSTDWYTYIWTTNVECSRFIICNLYSQCRTSTEYVLINRCRQSVPADSVLQLLANKTQQELYLPTSHVVPCQTSYKDDSKPL